MEARLRSYKKSPSKQSELPARIALALLLPVRPLLIRTELPFLFLRHPNPLEKEKEAKKGKKASICPQYGTHIVNAFLHHRQKNSRLPASKGALLQKFSCLKIYEVLEFNLRLESGAVLTRHRLAVKLEGDVEKLSGLRFSNEAVAYHERKYASVRRDVVGVQIKADDTTAFSLEDPG